MRAVAAAAFGSAVRLRLRLFLIAFLLLFLVVFLGPRNPLQKLLRVCNAHALADHVHKVDTIETRACIVHALRYRSTFVEVVGINAEEPLVLRVACVAMVVVIRAAMRAPGAV